MTSKCSDAILLHKRVYWVILFVIDYLKINFCKVQSAKQNENRIEERWWRTDSHNDTKRFKISFDFDVILCFIPLNFNWKSLFFIHKLRRNQRQQCQQRARRNIGVMDLRQRLATATVQQEQELAGAGGVRMEVEAMKDSSLVVKEDKPSVKWHEMIHPII